MQLITKAESSKEFSFLFWILYIYYLIGKITYFVGAFINPFSATIFCPSSLNMKSMKFLACSVITSSLLTNKNGLAIAYLSFFTFSAFNSTPSIVNAFTFSSTYPKDIYPIAFSFPSTS